MTTTSRRPIAILLGLAFLIAGCRGSMFKKQPHNELVLRQTSRPGSGQPLGPPYREGSVTRNGKQLKTMSYEFAMTGGTPAREGVTPTRGQGFYFLEDKLAGYDFNSSWKEDQSDFDATKVPQIKKGVSTRDDVVRLIGLPRGKYAYPLISSPKDQADVYLYAETKGGPFNLKFYQNHLIATDDQ